VGKQSWVFLIELSDVEQMREIYFSFILKLDKNVAKAKGKAGGDVEVKLSKVKVKPSKGKSGTKLKTCL
jgi:hypothetical protein